MPALRTLLVLALLTTAGPTAGCLGGALPDAGGEAAQAARAGENRTVLGNETRRQVYAFEAIVTGTSAAGGDDPALIEIFELPEGAADLVVEAEYYTGTGDGRIEVVDPEGVIIHRSGTHTFVGQPGSSAVGITREPAHAEDGRPVIAGTYEVRYHVTGSMEAIVGVSAKMPAQE